MPSSRTRSMGPVLLLFAAVAPTGGSTPCLTLLMRNLAEPSWGGVACAALLAMKHVNDRDGTVVPELAQLPPGFKITAEVFNTESDALIGLAALRQAKANGCTDGVVGAGSSSVSIPIAQQTALEGIPQVRVPPARTPRGRLCGRCRLTDRALGNHPIRRCRTGRHRRS